MTRRKSTVVRISGHSKPFCGFCSDEVFRWVPSPHGDGLRRCPLCWSPVVADKKR